jgi:nucleoside-diphosphate-sugar epimerase
MRVVLPGGAGFVGRNLIRVMIDEGFKPEDITVIDNSKRNLEFLEKYQVKEILADLAEKGDWYDEFNGKELVINLAAQISSPSYEPFYRNTVLTTKNVLDAAKIAGLKRIIHFGSAAVYSIRKDAYAQTKLEGEELVKNSGLEYCILHPSLMYGPTDDKNIGFLIEFAKKLPCFPIPGHGKWPRQPIYIDDVCHLIISMMHNFPENKVYSINGRDVIYFKDMIKIVLKQLDGFKFRVFLPISLFKFLMMAYQKLSGEIQFTADQVDSLTAKEVFPNYPWWDEFNIKITSFDEGVKRMLSYSGGL